MQVPHDAVLLRVFTSRADRAGLGPLHIAIVNRAIEMKLAGATVLHGVLGFGSSRHLRQGRLVHMPRDLPVVVEIVDSEGKIDSFLAVLDGIMGRGLVTLEKARVLQYGRQRAPLLHWIKEYFAGQAHRPVSG